jgi:hypothetical protein
MDARTALSRDHVKRFVSFFDALALTADYGPYNNRPAWIRKWTGPVTIVLQGEAEALRDKVRGLAGRITGWTGLNFRLANRNTKADSVPGNVITIRFVAEQDTSREFLADDIVCQTETHGLGGILHTGFVSVRPDYTDCLSHELMHALGFDAHWEPAEESAIRSVLAMRGSPARTVDFSEWDILAVQLLYDGRLRAGTSRSVGLMVVEELVTTRLHQTAAVPSKVKQTLP